MPTEVVFQGLPGGPVQIQFSDSIPHRTTCSKCHTISLSMYADKQGHIFCMMCLDQRSQQKTIFCDRENRTVPFDEMNEAYEVLTALKGMAVYCPNKKEGCVAVARLMNLQEHFLSCERTQLACTFCRKRFPGSRYEAHTKSCSEMPVQCSYCFKPQRRGSLPQHKKACGMQEQVCPKCTKKIPRMRFSVHDYQCTGSDVCSKTETDTAETADKEVSTRDITSECNAVTAGAEPPTISRNPFRTAENDVQHKGNLIDVGLQYDAATVIPEPFTTSRSPLTTSKSDVQYADAEAQTDALQMTRPDSMSSSSVDKRDAETQTDALQMPRPDSMSGSQVDEACKLLKELPSEMQQNICTLIKYLKVFTGHSLVLHFGVASEQSKNETGMQKMNDSAMPGVTHSKLASQCLKDGTHSKLAESPLSSSRDIVPGTHAYSCNSAELGSAGYACTTVSKKTEQDNALPKVQDLSLKTNEDRSPAETSCSQDDKEFHESSQSSTEVLNSQDSTAMSSYAFISEELEGNSLDENLPTDTADTDRCSDTVQCEDAATSTRRVEDTSYDHDNGFPSLVHHSPLKDCSDVAESSGHGPTESIEVIRLSDDYHQAEGALFSRYPVHNVKVCRDKMMEVGEGHTTSAYTGNMTSSKFHRDNKEALLHATGATSVRHVPPQAANYSLCMNKWGYTRRGEVELKITERQSNGAENKPCDAATCAQTTHLPSSELWSATYQLSSPQQEPAFIGNPGDVETRKPGTRQPLDCLHDEEAQQRRWVRDTNAQSAMEAGEGDDFLSVSHGGVPWSKQCSTSRNCNEPAQQQVIQRSPPWMSAFMKTERPTQEGKTKHRTDLISNDTTESTPL